jgi:hypothetical protein
MAIALDGLLRHPTAGPPYGQSGQFSTRDPASSLASIMAAMIPMSLGVKGISYLRSARAI